MSFQNKDFIDEFLRKQKEQGEEVREVRRLGAYFKETDKARQAKEVFLKNDFQDLRNRFSSFFQKSNPIKEGGV